FTLVYGGLVGLAVGAFYTPLTTVVSAAFTRNRGLALGLISAGAGLGNFAIAPLIRWLITTYDWRTAMLLLGDLSWLVTIPLALAIRAPGAHMARMARASGAERDLALGAVV